MRIIVYISKFPVACNVDEHTRCIWKLSYVYLDQVYVESWYKIKPAASTQRACSAARDEVI